MPQDVFSYITTEATNYKAKSISLGDNWNWNMYQHINQSFLMKNSKYSKGNNDLGNRPFKNIVKPILNVAYRTEGFDVKDIEPFVNDADKYYKSFIVRKFHPKWAIKNRMDTFIDELVESYVDYGGVLVKNVNDVRPEVVPLQRLAFVDQRDMLSGAICEKHDYSIDQLLEMKGKWWPTEIDKAIVLARAEKPNSTGTGTEKSNNKSIEVFELHGNFPETWLDEDGDPDKYTSQIHIVTYYKGSDDKKVGIELFRGKEYKQIYKALVRDGIYNRALGTGGIEELFEPQVWVNYDIIQIKEMLDVASLMILQTADDTFANRNKITDLKKGEILKHADDKPITQINISPVNMADFINSINAWEQAGRTTGSASDPQLGINPSSGTPLGTTQIVTNQGQGMHEYRRGQIAVFVEEIYRDWVLNFMVREINRGHKWIEELSLDELQDVAEKVAVNESNERIKQLVLSGKMPSTQDQDTLRQLIKESFMKKGSKHFIEAVEGELSKLPVDVMVNIAGKQQNLSAQTDKLSNVFKEMIANPQGFIQAMQIPAIAKTFNQLLEGAGLDQINFGGMKAPEMVLPSPRNTNTPANPSLAVAT